MAPHPRPPRPLLPGALLLLGIAASCWCACYNGPSAAQVREVPLQQIRDALAPSMPPPAWKSLPESERLQVTGELPLFQVTAVGNFSRTESEALVDRARAIVVLGQRPALVLHIYSDQGGTRTLVDSLTIDPAGELLRALRAIPADPSLGEIQIHVTVLARTGGDLYQANLSGAFSADRAEVVMAAIRRIHRSMFGAARFSIQIMDSSANRVEFRESLNLPPEREP